MVRRGLLLLLAAALLCLPAGARETNGLIDDSGIYDSVPKDALVPAQGTDLSRGLGEILTEAIGQARTSLGQAAGLCAAMLAVTLLCALCSMGQDTSPAVDLAGTLGLSALFTSRLSALLGLGTETLGNLSEYGKVLLPVMAGAMTASGQVTSSTALYLGTAIFDTVLVSLADRVLVPCVYVLLALTIANSAAGNDLLSRLRDFVKNLATWGLRILLYVFTGYMTLTGVMSGKADAAAVKAAKLTISTAVPVVGGILADASESVVLGAELLKSSAGVYGALVMVGICAVPFLRLGIQYLMLKATAALCAVLGGKTHAGLIDGFSQALGLVLAMVAAGCLMQLISLVCFMKGVG